MEAIITVLNPGSPYEPWNYGPPDAQSGDTVAFVLNTDPPSILTNRAEVGADGDLRSAVFNQAPSHATLMDLTTVATVVGLETVITDRWWFDGEDADKLESVLEECRYISAPSSRVGHTSVAAARILLRFYGQCDGCDHTIDLAGPDARGRLFVHTVDPRLTAAEPSSTPDDWPAVLCRNCIDHMADAGYTNFVAFKFALNPPCPECAVRRTRATFYGMPSEHWNIEPWSYAGGCCPSPAQWCCGECYHRW